MHTVTFENQAYSVATDENILSCFLRNGIEYPNSCQAGICQSCLIKASDGLIEPSWQEGLPETLKAQGYFLACLAKPCADIVLVAPDSSECDVEAVIIDIERLNYNVLKVKLQVADLHPWIPGQYLNLINASQIVRSYSIANIPLQDGFIEIHIKLVENGAMSQWLMKTGLCDMSVRIRGPFGKCYYYNPEGLAFDMLLAGTGTGLAPLIGIIKSALTQGHKGRITLVHGGLIDADIYYAQELETIAALFPNFHFEPCVLRGDGRYPLASIQNQAVSFLNNPKDTLVYVCGPKDTSNTLKTSMFLAGVPSKAILSDVFL